MHPSPPANYFGHYVLTAENIRVLTFAEYDRACEAAADLSYALCGEVVRVETRHGELVTAVTVDHWQEVSR